MQDINRTLQELRNNYQLSAGRRKPLNDGGSRSAPVCSPKTEEAMVTLWEKMGQLFGAKWLRQFGDTDEPAFDTWCQYLADLEPEQIKAGFVNMLRDKPKFLPDAVRFREYCLDLAGQGLPSIVCAYEEACLAPSPKVRQKWSHPAVYHAGMRTGWSDLHALPREEGQKRFAYHYDVLCRRVAAGEDLTIRIPEAIPENIPRVLEPDEAANEMQKLRGATGL